MTTSYVPEYLKMSNRKLIYDLFVKNRVMARSDVVSKTNMSFPTASKSIDYFIGKGIIMESDMTDDKTSGPGRRRRMLVFNSSSYAALTMNFQGDIVEIGIVNLSGEVLLHEEREFADFLDVKAHESLGRRIARLVRQSSIPILGIGISLPSNVNPYTNEIMSYYSVGVSSIISIDSLVPNLVKHIDLPYFVDNDVNLAALGELFNRGGDEKANLCYLTLGSGYGAGIIIDGSLYLGSQYRAGEIGNILVRPADGDMGTQPIPLEYYINIRALNERFSVNIREDAIDDAMKADMIAYLVPYLAMSIYNISFFLDISAFILDGFIPDLLGERLLQITEGQVNALLAARRRSVSITRSAKKYSSLVGAAVRVFERTLIDRFDD